MKAIGLVDCALVAAMLLGTLMMGAYVLMRMDKRLRSILKILNEHNNCCNYPTKDAETSKTPD